MLAVGALSVLTDRLMSDASETVKHSCAVTLGYLTYKKTAARVLFSDCRNTPGLYDQIITQIGPAAMISSDFITDYECARKVGLPCMRYCNFTILFATIFVILESIISAQCWPSLIRLLLAASQH